MEKAACIPFEQRRQTIMNILNKTHDEQYQIILRHIDSKFVWYSGWLVQVHS